MIVIILWMKTREFIFQKEVKKNKTNPQCKMLKAQQLWVANNTLLQANKYYTASKTLTFSLASSDVYSNTDSQTLNLGIKKALACSRVRTRQNCKVELFQQQREMQAWPVGSQSILVLGFPCFWIVWGKGQQAQPHPEWKAQTKELEGITEPDSSLSM